MASRNTPGGYAQGAVYGLPAWLVHRLYDKEFYYLIEAGDIPSREGIAPIGEEDLP